MAANASRRQFLILGALGVALALVLAYQLRGWWSAPSAPSARTTQAGARTGVRAGERLQVPDVRLEALTQAKPVPVEGGRNLFREQPKTAPAPPPGTVRRAAPSTPPVPAGPPPPPPITLKFIGIIQAGGQSLAVLSDGGDVLYGREGELVDGRFRIIKINVESIDISYADGRGRRVIPLTG